MCLLSLCELCGESLPSFWLRLRLRCVTCLAAGVSAAQLVDGQLESKLVPSPIESAGLLPDGYEAAKDPLPLLFFLPGGGEDKSFLARMRPTIEEM